MQLLRSARETALFFTYLSSRFRSLSFSGHVLFVFCPSVCKDFFSRTTGYIENKKNPTNSCVRGKLWVMTFSKRRLFFGFLCCCFLNSATEYFAPLYGYAHFLAKGCKIYAYDQHLGIWAEGDSTVTWGLLFAVSFEESSQFSCLLW